MRLPRFRLRSLLIAVAASACIFGGLVQFSPPHEPGDFQRAILLIGVGTGTMALVLSMVAVGEG